MAKLHYPNPQYESRTFCGKDANTDNSTYMSMDVTCITCNTGLYDMGASYNESLGVKTKSMKSIARKLDPNRGTWFDLQNSIAKVYRKKDSIRYHISISGTNRIDIAVPNERADKVGKNLSSQVAKFKKRHGLVIRTKMERTRLNIGGKTSTRFTITRVN